MGVCETCVRVFVNERACREGCLHNFMNQGLIDCEQLPLIAHMSTSWCNSHISTLNIQLCALKDVWTMWECGNLLWGVYTVALCWPKLRP